MHEVAEAKGCLPVHTLNKYCIAQSQAALRDYAPVLATSYDACSFLNLDYGSCVSYIMAADRCRFEKGELHVV